MRLLLKIQPKNKLPIQYPRRYIRDFIYSILKGTEFDYMHDSRYKHFCYSNVFPYQEDKKYFYPGNTKTLIISSPFNGIIELVGTKLVKERNIKLGDNNLKVESIKFLEPLKTIQKIVTATPIIVRIPEGLFEKYHIEANKDYVFWDKNKFLNVFYEAILKNGVRRYKDYMKLIDKETSLEEDNLPTDLIESFKFKKFVYGWDKHFNGSKWEFKIKNVWQESPFMKYIYDSGIGERNASSGAGFVNVIRD